MSFSLFKSQIKIAIRNLQRDRTYIFINIIGLGVGIASLIWAFQNYRFSMTGDNFHVQGKEIYRGLIVKEGLPDLQGIFPLPLVKLAEEEFEDVKETSRIMYRTLTIRTESGIPLTDEVLFSDPAFCNMFSFPVLRGTSRLLDPPIPESKFFDPARRLEICI